MCEAELRYETPISLTQRKFKIKLLEDEHEKLGEYISKIKQNNSVDDECRLSSVLNHIRLSSDMLEGVLRNETILPAEMNDDTHMPVTERIYPNEKLEKQLILKRTRKPYRKKGMSEPETKSKRVQVRKKEIAVSGRVQKQSFTPRITQDDKLRDMIMDTIYGVSTEIGITLLDLKSLDPYTSGTDLTLIRQYDPKFVCGWIRVAVIENYLTYLSVHLFCGDNCISVSARFTTQMREANGSQELMKVIQCEGQAILLQKDIVLCPLFTDHWTLIVLQFSQHTATVLDLSLIHI